MSDIEDLEFSILTAMVKHNRLALDFVSKYTHDLFVTKKHQVLCSMFVSYIKDYKSVPTRKVMLELFGEEDRDINLIEEFFDQCDDTVYNEAEWEYDLSKLKKECSKKKIKTLKDYLENQDIDGINDSFEIDGILKTAQRQINDAKAVDEQKAYNRKPIKEYIPEFTKAYLDKYNNPDLGKGIMTGYSFLDYIKNGLRPADLIIVAAETGAGKSMLMNNIAIQTWLQENRVGMDKSSFTKGYNVAYFSLEMPYADCFRRTMARLADVPSYGLRDAKLTKAEAKGLSTACRFIKEYPYTFDIIDVPRGLTIEQLEATFEELKANYTPDVVFIDYLGLMENADSGDDQDWLALGLLAGKVHEFARVHSVPVVTAVQLNRIDPDNKKKTSKSVGLHRIGRSSLIATHATLIIQIETREDEEAREDFVYHIIKNRDGESGKSASIWKNFSKCSIIDKPYDAENTSAWEAEDISEDISGIISDIWE